MVPAVSRPRRREASGMIEDLTACFDGLVDPRITRRCDHRLIDILVIAVSAVIACATLLHGYANPLKRLDTSEAVNLHKCLILLDSCQIHATRCWTWQEEKNRTNKRDHGLSFETARL